LNPKREESKEIILENLNEEDDDEALKQQFDIFKPTDNDPHIYNSYFFPGI